MSAEVLREFLVRVNYEERGRREFEDGLQSASLKAGLLARAIVSAAKFVAESVSKIASGLDQLYFASQRTNASAQNIRAFSYAVSQMGGTVDSARSSIENFAKTLRTNPGAESFLRSQGVRTRNGDGSARDSVEMMRELGKALGNRPYYIAKQYADLFGIDEPTLKALIKGTGDFESEYAKAARAIGLNSAEAAKRGNDFMTALRSLLTTIEVVSTKIASELAPHLEKLVTGLNEWLKNNVDTVSRALKYLSDTISQLSTFFGKLVEAMNPAWQTFEKIAQSLTGQNGLTLALEIFAAWVAATWVARILASFGIVRVGLMRLALLGAGLGAIVGGANIAAAPASSAQTPEGQKTAIEANSKVASIKRWWADTMPSWLGGGRPQPGGTDNENADNRGGSGGSRSWRNNNPGNIKFGPYAAAMGATGADSGGFAIFPDYGSGRTAQKRLLFEGPNYAGKTIAGAISTWAPAGDGNDPARYAAQVAAALGVSPDTALSSLTPEQQSKMLDAMQRKEGWIRGQGGNPGSAKAPAPATVPNAPPGGVAPGPVAVPSATLGGASTGGEGSAVVTQTNNFRGHGQDSRLPDPKKAGGSSSDLVRNTQGAIR